MAGAQNVLNKLLYFKERKKNPVSIFIPAESAPVIYFGLSAPHTEYAYAFRSLLHVWLVRSVSMPSLPWFTLCAAVHCRSVASPCLTHCGSWQVHCGLHCIRFLVCTLSIVVFAGLSQFCFALAPLQAVFGPLWFVCGAGI